MTDREAPLLLTLSIDATVPPRLEERGWRVLSGSVGYPYSVRADGRSAPLCDSSNLPSGHAEADIVILDLLTRYVESEPRGRRLGHANLGLYVEHKTPTIDPRPVAVAQLSESFGQILAHGGIIIVFADKRVQQQFESWEEHSQRDVLGDTWSFLDCVSEANLDVAATSGRSIRVTTETSRFTPVADVMRRYATDMSFTCTVTPTAFNDVPWTALATNKFDAPVAGCFEVEQGLVFLLPQLGEQLEPFLADLLQDALPDVQPRLFPNAAKGSWVHYPEYELPSIIELSERIAEIKSDALARERELADRIELTRQQEGFQYELLRGTGQTLTTAVKAGLLRLGLESVDDVNGDLREDLRIVDSSLANKILLAEVKGVGGLPGDDDVTQVAKYVPLCMKDEKCTEVGGITIINYERHVPPLERSPEPFREDILTSCESLGIGLLTTWDLFRLIRGIETLHWPPEVVKPLFDRVGRIAPIPTHYSRLGTIAKFYEQAGVFQLRVTEGSIRMGDTIALALPTGYVEQVVSSLHVDNSPAEHAEAGMLVGIATTYTKALARKGTTVFHVANPQLS